MTDQKKDQWIELINKRVEITILRNNSELSYTGLVTEISGLDSDRKIYFIDRKGDLVISNLNKVIFIKEIEG